MERVFNFSAGPSVLPESVLKIAQAELMNYKGCGTSVMEMSHRSKIYLEIFDNSTALLKEIMDVPDNYKILFLQGGASTQFAMIPMNLLTDKKTVDIVDSGHWAHLAVKESIKFAKTNVVASSKDSKYDHFPVLDPAKFTPDADYFHYTSNNTIFGTKLSAIPQTGNVPLVCDMSSNILSEVYDVSKFGLIYAGAQKNMGPAGVTVVIIRDDLLARSPESLPTMFNYNTHVNADGMYNTPPTYGVYLAGLVYQWVKDLGGVSAVHKINEEKAGLIYDCIDNSAIYKGYVAKQDRSLMNITFNSGNEERDNKFCKEAEKAGLVNLKGYRTVGGMRVSTYNAMPIEGCRALVEFMKKFEMENK